MPVLGVDACPEGWVGIRLESGGEPSAFCASTIQDLVGAGGPVDVIGIDIPIGLPTDSPRQAEVLARKLVGPRASSVFTPPPRAVLEASSHAEASAMCRRLTGQGVTQQAYRLGPKILQVDDWLPSTSMPVVEVHPEVSFAAMAGAVLPEPKTTWAGFQLRRRLLAGVWILLDDDLGLPGLRVGVDDVLDAAAVAWSAQRVSRGEAVALPDPPEDLGDGRVAAIWY